MTKREWSRYLQKVKRKLLCPHSIKKTIIENFKQQILEYIEQNPDSTVQEMINLFGSPQLVAQRYLSVIDSKVLDKFKNRIRILKVLFFIIILGILALIFGVITHERPGKIVEGVATELTILNFYGGNRL